MHACILQSPYSLRTVQTEENEIILIYSKPTCADGAPGPGGARPAHLASGETSMARRARIDALSLPTKPIPFRATLHLPHLRVRAPLAAASVSAASPNGGHDATEAAALDSMGEKDAQAQLPRSRSMPAPSTSDNWAADGSPERAPLQVRSNEKVERHPGWCPYACSELPISKAAKS